MLLKTLFTPTMAGQLNWWFWICTFIISRGSSWPWPPVYISKPAKVLCWQLRIWRGKLSLNYAFNCQIFFKEEICFQVLPNGDPLYSCRGSSHFKEYSFLSRKYIRKYSTNCIYNGKSKDQIVVSWSTILFRELSCVLGRWTWMEKKTWDDVRKVASRLENWHRNSECSECADRALNLFRVHLALE